MYQHRKKDKEKENALQLKKSGGAKAIHLTDFRGKQDTIQKKEVIQLADDGEPGRSIRNLISYSADTIATYGEATVKRVINATRIYIPGHHSGASGSGMNQATTDAIARLIAALKEDAKSTKEAKDDDDKEVVYRAPNLSSGAKKHNKEKQEELADAKAKKKADKKAQKQQLWQQNNQRGGRGGGRGGRGGGASGAAQIRH